ncbi:MAG TPA: CYTH and CHAD domain-containing protein [Candidatus Dormibacteraeota bacterium]|jgi:CHAD domain-containing protein
MSTTTPPAVHRERELKLAAPPDFRLLDLGSVAEDVVITAADERRLTTVYWDTPDLRLIRWGCTLRHRAGEGWTVKLPKVEHSALLVRDEHNFPGPPSAPPEAAVDLVRAYVRTASLSTVVRMRTVRRAVSVLSADGRLLAEIDDDDVYVQQGRKVTGRFRELEVEMAADGSDALLDAIVERLRAGGAGAADPTPKLVRALGTTAVGPPEVVAESLDGAATAGAVVRRAIAASVARLLRHDPGVRLGGEPEDVHQARVATRRLRSDLRTFAPLVDEAWATSLSEELRWLAAELGTVRDAEVLAERIHATASRLPAQDVEAGRHVADQLVTGVAGARDGLLAALHDPRYVALLDRLVLAAHSPMLTTEADGPARKVLPGLVDIPWSKLWRDGRRLDATSPDAELHALRIRAKRVRYAAEAVAPVMGPRATRFAAAVTNLQTVLGEHQDAVIAGDWLHQHGPQSGQPFAAGQLWALERAAADEARRQWPAAWKRTTDRSLRTWF